MKKLTEILKTAGEYCTIGAGVVTILVGVVAAFVALPAFVPFVVAAGIGIGCAAIGGYKEAQKLQREALRERRAAAQRDQDMQDLKLQLDEIKQSLELHQRTIASHERHLNHHPHLEKAQARVAKMQGELHKAKIPLFSENRNPSHKRTSSHQPMLKQNQNNF